jgi:HAE1 family hydrophobic/amphiphilic exporter-1
MGLLVIGGLASSTFLTLIVVPVAYTLVADLALVPGKVASSASRLLGRRGVPTKRLAEPAAPEGR